MDARRLFALLPSAALMAAVLVGTPGLSAQTTPLNVSGTLRVDGGSTVRSWSCSAKTINAQAAAAPGASLSLAGLGQAVQSLRIDIPARDLDCDNDTMNGHMWDALKTNQHPGIQFQMQRYTVTPGAAGTARVQLQGELSLSGARHPITVVLDASEEAGGALRVQGTHTLNMTRWDIRPPRLMLGTLRVHEDVEIHMDLRLSPR